MLELKDGQISFKLKGGKIKTRIVLFINNQIFSTVLASRKDLDAYFGNDPRTSAFASDMLIYFPVEKRAIAELTIVLQAQIYTGIEEL